MAVVAEQKESKMGVLLLFNLLLWKTLQATMPPALWRSRRPAAPVGRGSWLGHCSASGFLMTSAASPRAHAGMAPCTCRLQGEEGGDKHL